MTELTLNDWADLAEVVSAASIIGGLLFGFFQIRHFQQQQRNAIATNLTQTFYSRDLAQALALLQQLPEGIGAKEMRALGQQYPEAAITVTTSFETMGLLVYRNIAPLDLVLDLAGGIITVMHRKLNTWQQDIRQEQDQPSWGEWFDWLGNQAIIEKKRQAPAHIRHRDWKP